MLKAVDGSASYSYAELTNLVADIFLVDNPARIYTHVAGGQLSEGDHSDHRAVGTLTMLARAVAKSTAPVSMFVGYPDNGLPPNLTDSQRDQKSIIFAAYASEDGVICGSPAFCARHIQGTYGRYFSRRYVITGGDQPLHLKPAKKRPSKPQPSKTHMPLDLFQHNLE
jgi:hypothetical protein